MKEKLRNIVDNNTSKAGRVFDSFIQILIFLSLITFSLETIQGISSSTKSIFHNIEIFCVVVFTIEYLLRIFVSEKPLKYIFSFYGIIDLLAIFPFYLKSAVDLRALRAFRIFKIFRTLKLIRYNRALHRFQIAARIVKEELVLFFIVSGILVFLSATGIYFFENTAQPDKFSSIFHSIWWAIVTLTTVGYGDVYPITIGGKIFTFFVLILGVGIVTVPASLLATSLSKAREIEEKEKHNSQKGIR